jgi:speckle-type POZ protein
MADLSDPMKGKGAPRVRIDNMEAKVFKAMLHFIYTDTLPEIGEEEIVEMAQHLLVAADRFNIERLKLICEEILCKHIRKDTAATMLALAEQRGCDGLRDACLKFLSSLDMLKAVVATDGFTHLRSSCPSILEVLVTNVAP